VDLTPRAGRVRQLAAASLLLVVAGGAAGLLALGKVAIKQLQALRAPLDAALDVDNHFREFPRHAISRVRIVERYVALLDHLRAQGYERVVIVAHSQGTVITAELLRYLQQRSRLAGRPRHPRARPGGPGAHCSAGWTRTGVHLLTVGSPLRQLYALRFPSQYPWVLQARGAQQRPPTGAARSRMNWACGAGPTCGAAATTSAAGCGRQAHDTRPGAAASGRRALRRRGAPGPATRPAAPGATAAWAPTRTPTTSTSTSPWWAQSCWR
jgi:hypothetical protein